MRLNLKPKLRRSKFNLMSKPYYIVSDGACMKNPGPGGWGMILATPSDHVIEFGGYEAESTNNRMELMGFYRGLQEVYRRAKEEPGNKILHAISDSKYVLDGAAKYVKNWERNGWKTSTGDAVKNQEMWEKVAKGLGMFKDIGFKIEYELVKGHSGNDANERVDQIAVKYSRSEEHQLNLYDGPLSKYPIQIQTGAPFALTYLALVDGKLQRHSTWDACKAAVEGKAGAKYKKVTNRLQEKETLETWGLKP
jgi:ribonuclease HI